MLPEYSRAGAEMGGDLSLLTSQKRSDKAHPATRKPVGQSAVSDQQWPQETIQTFLTWQEAPTVHLTILGRFSRLR